MTKTGDITSHLFSLSNEEVVTILVVTEGVFNTLCDEIKDLNLGDLSDDYRPVDEALMAKIKSIRCLPWIVKTEKTADLFEKYGIMTVRFTAIIREDEDDGSSDESNT